MYLLSHDGLSLSGLQKPTPYFKIHLLIRRWTFASVLKKERAGYTFPFLYCHLALLLPSFYRHRFTWRIYLSNILTFCVRPSYNFLVGLVKLMKPSVTGGFLFVCFCGSTFSTTAFVSLVVSYLSGISVSFFLKWLWWLYFLENCHFQGYCIHLVIVFSFD